MHRPSSACQGMGNFQAPAGLEAGKPRSCGLAGAKSPRPGGRTWEGRIPARHGGTQLGQTLQCQPVDAKKGRRRSAPFALRTPANHPGAGYGLNLEVIAG